MKRTGFVLLAVLFSLQMAGCGMVHLTTQENNVIAEYIANILLKHDTTYEPAFQYDLEEPEEEPEEQKEDDAANPTPEEENAGNTTAPEDGAAQTPESGTSDYVRISAIYQKSLKVSSSGYSFYKTYPKKVNAVLPIEASKGNTICIVRLNIKNTSSSAKKVNFLTEDYSYELEVNGKNTYKAVQSLLVDDIQYLNVNLKSGKSCQAVAAFEIPEKAKKKPLKLFVTREGKTAVLNLK